MTWSVWADPFETSDMTGVSKYIRFKPSTNHLSLDGCFTYVMFKNPGSFTDLKMKLYADRAGLPSGLIATSSTSYDRSDILETYNNGIKYLGFKFASRISLNKDTYYHLVLNCTGYTYAAESHMAWIKAWPDPIYEQPASYVDLLRNSYMFGLIGATL